MTTLTPPTTEPCKVINGVPWWLFAYEYDWEGETVCFTVRARSWEEADARLKRLPLARCVGVLDGWPIDDRPNLRFVKAIFKHLFGRITK